MVSKLADHRASGFRGQGIKMDQLTYTAVATGTNARGDKVCQVTDSDGNSMTLNLCKDGAVCDDRNCPIGINGDDDYKAIRKMMQAA